MTPRKRRPRAVLLFLLGLFIRPAVLNASVVGKHLDSTVAADRLIHQLQSKTLVPAHCQSSPRRAAREAANSNRQLKRKYKWFTVLLEAAKIKDSDVRLFEEHLSLIAPMEGPSTVQIMPNVSEGSLGRCAVVALSGRLNHGCAGAFIDSHDTVIRLGHAKSTGYVAKVGVKKSISHVMAARARMTCEPDLKKPGREHDGLDPTQPEFWLLPDRCGPPHKELDPRTQKVAQTIAGYEERTIALVRAFKHLVRFPSQYTPPDFKMTSGLKTTLLMLASRACTSISLFGFGTGMEPHYLSTRVQESAIKHSYSLELWMQTLLMQQRGDVCLYDYQLNPPPSNCDYDGTDVITAYQQAQSRRQVGGGPAASSPDTLPHYSQDTL
jgi:hypothetical protein